MSKKLETATHLEILIVTVNKIVVSYNEFTPIAASRQ